MTILSQILVAALLITVIVIVHFGNPTFQKDKDK